jgi:hypothetical protein
MADRIRELANMSDVAVTREAELRGIDTTGKTTDELRQELLHRGSFTWSWPAGNFVAAVLVIIAAGFVPSPLATVLGLLGLAMLVLDVVRIYERTPDGPDKTKNVVRQSIDEGIGILVIVLGLVFESPLMFVTGAITLVVGGAREKGWL